MTVAAYTRSLNAMDGPHRFGSLLASLENYLSTASSLMDHCVGLVTEFSEEVGIALVVTAIQHGVGVTRLGQIGRSGLLPAAAAARAAFEAGLKAAWLLRPTEGPTRMTRVRAYFEANRRFLTKEATDLRSIGSPDALRLAQLYEATVKSNAEWLSQRLPIIDSVGERAPGVPSPEKILAELGLSIIYPWYREASQFTHSEPDALRHVADFANDGRLTSFGNRSREVEWGPSLLMCLNGVNIPAERLLELTRANRSVRRQLPVAYRRVEAATFSLYGIDVWDEADRKNLPTGAFGGAVQHESLTGVWRGGSAV